MDGRGQQHKAFIYSKEGLSTGEKAYERAKHYRRLKQVEAGGDVIVQRQVSMPARPYTLTKQDEENKASRGLKDVKSKDESTRQVGSRMKKDFLEAMGLDADSKEGKNALNKAKRDYKAGTMPWASLYTKGAGLTPKEEKAQLEDIIKQLGKDVNTIKKGVEVLEVIRKKRNLTPKEEEHAVKQPAMYKAAMKRLEDAQEEYYNLVKGRPDMFR
jgi:hypothetical protein